MLHIRYVLPAAWMNSLPSRPGPVVSLQLNWYSMICYGSCVLVELTCHQTTSSSLNAIQFEYTDLQKANQPFGYTTVRGLNPLPTTSTKSPSPSLTIHSLQDRSLRRHWGFSPRPRRISLAHLSSELNRYHAKTIPAPVHYFTQSQHSRKNEIEQFIALLHEQSVQE